eukprot:g71680.t1
MSQDQKGRLTRWQQELAEYHFTIEYLKGKDNVKADTMSRQGKDKIEQEEIKEDEVYSIRVRLEDPVHDGTGYARFRFTTPESVFAMSGCTLSLEELENDRDFNKKKPRGLVCYKRDNWKTSVHFDCLDNRIYEVYDEILWKESEKADSLYDTQDVMDYEKSWKEVSEESAFPDHGGLAYPLEGKSLEDRVEDLGDQHPDRAALSEAEALGRIQDGFKNPPKVDGKEAEDNTNVQIGDEEIAEEHKREQSRQAVQRAGLFKTEDSDIKVGSIPMDTEEESSPEPTETEEVKRDRLDHKHSKLEPIGKLWIYG